MTKILAPAILTVPLIFLPLKKVNAQFQINPFAQPNDSTLVYYGSGDVDSNNVRNWDDYNLMLQGIQNEQADVDGDGVYSTSQDASLFADYLSNGTLLPQIHWAWPNLTPEQRTDWLEKMLAIDKTDEIPYHHNPDMWEEWICGNYSTQLQINFSGYARACQDTFIPAKYDTTQNGRFNLPLYSASISFHPGHHMNAFLVGEDPSNFYDWCMIEPQNDDINVQPGGWNIPYGSSIWINKIRKFSEHSDLPLLDTFLGFQVDDEGSVTCIYKDSNLLTTRPEVGIAQEFTKTPTNFILEQNYPNPFNNETLIRYNLARKSDVSLKVYDILGQRLETIVDSVQEPGFYSVVFNAQNYPSGIYFYTLKAEKGQLQTKKMILVK